MYRKEVSASRDKGLGETGREEIRDRQNKTDGTTPEGNAKMNVSKKV